MANPYDPSEPIGYENVPDEARFQRENLRRARMSPAEAAQYNALHLRGAVPGNTYFDYPARETNAENAQAADPWAAYENTADDRAQQADASEEQTVDPWSGYENTPEEPDEAQGESPQEGMSL